MGSATTQARQASIEALSAQTIDFDTARDLFAAARVIGQSSPLSGALADPSAQATAREALVSSVFAASLTPAAVSALKAAAVQRWSSAADLVDGVEELAIRATSVADKDADIEGELFRVSRIVAENPDLELALGSRLGDGTKKSELVEKLLTDRASKGTTLIVSSMVAQPRERRVRQMLSRASSLVSDQRGRSVATVVAASALTDEQQSRLAATLSAKYGRSVSLNVVIDPKVVGGIRVQIADDVIDGSVSSRLADVRHKLAG